MASKRHKRKLSLNSIWWKSRLIVAAVTLACANSQDITACCDKAAGGCRSVCEKVWNDQKCKVRAKLVSINSGQRATGGGPSNEPSLSPLENRVACIIGMDVGPLPNTMQNQLDPGGDGSNSNTVEEDESEAGNASPTIIYQINVEQSEQLSPEPAEHSAAPMSVAGPSTQHTGVVLTETLEETPRAPTASAERVVRARERRRLERRRRQASASASAQVQTPQAAQPSRSALDQSRNMVLRCEELRAEAALRISEATKTFADAFKLVAESIDRMSRQMSLVEIASDSAMREERIQNIYKFCTPHLIEFWICMNQTIQEVVSGSSWWGRVCCALGRSASCRHACATAANSSALDDACRHSDEIAFFDCVQKQYEAQSCCSQTQSLSCHESCRSVLWRYGQGARVDLSAKERAVEFCEQSPDLLHCLRDLTASTVHADTSKYLPCCHESANQECRTTCESVLRRTGDSQEIANVLSRECGAPALHDGLWQCFLRTDAPTDVKDVIPHDVAKLHCCQKATTINCRRLCFNTFNNDWQNNWQKFYAECLGDPQEMDLTQCIEEVDTPCSLGCAGLTYCSQLNNRPTNLFRSCSSQADLDAHLAVAEQKGSGYVTVSGLKLPLKNSTQCTSDVWKSVACALHVKPCTAKGHSSLLCTEDCMRLVSSCVEWSRTPPQFTAQALCARLAPRSSTAPCVPLRQFMSPSTEPPLLSANEAVTSPCAGSPCNATQVCVVNRNCMSGGSCSRYTCVDGCPLGDGSAYVVPIGAWTRIPMTSPAQKACYKICRCTNKGLTHCQPLPCLALENCRLHDKIVPHGDKYYMECNPCACVLGERVCSRRACGRAVLLTGLPCNCPPHHLPVHTPRKLYPNACLAKCAGATDAEIEFGSRSPCEAMKCPWHACLPAPNVCLSRLQTSCPQHVCVNTTNCNSQPAMPVCDSDGRTHANPCHLFMSGRHFAYWGQCLQRCSQIGRVCGVNGVTFYSECAAWAEFVSVDYLGPCLAVGPISDLMEPKCQIDRIICPVLKKPNCQGFTAPGACCPKCGGALRILYSKKQIDRALYGTNISATVINLSNVLKSLERHVKIAECVLRGFLTIEMEIFVTIESVLENPTDLQLNVCVLEAEKIADLINRESALISSDLGLSALSYAIPVHTYPTSAASSFGVSIIISIISFVILVLR